MSVVHIVTGFDKASEEIEREFDIPDELVVVARRIAEAPPDWQNAPGAFALDSAAVRALGALLGQPMNVDRYDWFLEPVAR